jgi:hypothetical protein
MMNMRFKLRWTDYVMIGIVIVLIIAGIIHMIEAAMEFIANLF